MKLIDIGMKAVKESVAGLYDIRLDEANDQVAIRVRRRHMDDLDRLSGEMELHPGDDRHGRNTGRVRRIGLVHRSVRFLCRDDMFPRLLTREDDYAGLREPGISTDMIPMPVSVHQVSDRLRRDVGYGSDDFIMQLRPFRVHQKNALVAGEHADIAAEAL